MPVDRSWPDDERDQRIAELEAALRLVDDDNGAGTPAGQNDRPMATHTGLRDGTNRDVAIQYGTSACDTQFVDRMFDEYGAETTDPVAAVEVEIDGGLIRVTPGGVFDIKVVVDANQ